MDPKRVVVLDTAPLDAALALDVQPVGTTIYRDFPPYLEETANEITLLGDPNQPDLEAILSLKPDLILGSKLGAEKLYQRLSQIAPTVFTEGSGRVGEGEWQENFRLYAEALGQTDQADQLIQRYQQRVQQLQAIIGQPQVLDISVLVISSERVGTYTTGSFSGSILQDVGFSRTAAQDVTRRFALQLSREALDRLDGDYIFLIYSTYQSGGVQKKEFVADPIWSQLKAVQQEHICEVAGDVWIAGRSILAANQILTDVESCLSPDQSGSS
ncbi:MAG: iron-siderophore ABC transporter substrate-binding protein [Cyanobacteria bacterium P01_G01_bin.38]